MNFLSSTGSQLPLIFLLLIVLIFLGIMNIINPRKMIKFRHLFEFKNDPEPTDFAIAMTRFAGVVLIITAIILFTIVLQV